MLSRPGTKYETNIRVRNQHQKSLNGSVVLRGTLCMFEVCCRQKVSEPTPDDSSRNAISNLHFTSSVSCNAKDLHPETGRCSRVGSHYHLLIDRHCYNHIV